MTDLDDAYLAMQAAGATEAAGLRFYRRLADATLFLLLEHEAEGAEITPRVFHLESGPVLLAFDSEERLAGLDAGPQPYAALPGRVIAGLMAGQGLGQGLSLGLNLGSTAAAQMLVPPEALAWLVAMLDQLEARPEGFRAPAGLPEAVARALQDLFDGAAGLASGAMLAGVRYAGGGQGHLLAVLDAQAGAQSALARAVAEALAFSGVEAAAIDVVFLSSTDPVAGAMAAVARGFAVPGLPPDLPGVAPPLPPTAPGMNPDQPPRLR